MQNCLIAVCASHKILKMKTECISFDTLRFCLPLSRFYEYAQKIRQFYFRRPILAVYCRESRSRPLRLCSARNWLIRPWVCSTSA